MIRFYILGKNDNKHSIMDYDFKDIRGDYQTFEKELIEQGYSLDFEDESGFHYVFNREYSIYAHIVRLDVPFI